MARHVLCVLSNAIDGADERFNDWYDNTHLGDVLRLPGYVAAERFKLSQTQLGGGEAPFGYLALYEVDVDDLSQAAAALTSAADMYIDPALDRENTKAWFFTPIGQRVEAVT